MKSILKFAALALALAALVWLVTTDSNLARSCEHRGGHLVETDGAATCVLAPK